MNCPVCKIELKMSDRHGVEIDYCPQCRGVWLDRGELDKIIERASASSAATLTPPAHPGDHHPERGYDHHSDNRDHHRGYDDHHHGHDGYHKKHKRESFLGDLFDF